MGLNINLTKESPCPSFILYYHPPLPFSSLSEDEVSGISCLLWNEYPAKKGFPSFCCKWSGKQGVPQQETHFILPFSFLAPQHGYRLRSCCFLQRSKMVEAGRIKILDKSWTVKNHLTSWILPPWAHKLATCQEGQIASDSKKKASHVKHVRRFNDQNITLLKKEYWSD